MGGSRSGFASMTPARRTEVARMGGRKVQALGTAHRWTSETARVAGIKGGGASHPARGLGVPPRTEPTTQPDEQRTGEDVI